MTERLKKIDEFLDSLEKSSLSASQTSYVLSPNEGEIGGAGANFLECINGTVGSCSYNEGICTNSNVDACSTATNIGTIQACANPKIDYVAVCLQPSNPNTGPTCAVTTNRDDSSCGR